MTDLPPALIDYFARRERQRTAAVDAFLAGLTDRERGLLHDAAVMGYVQGLMRDRAEGCPKDSVVMALVVDACLANPDLYPAVNAGPETFHRTVVYFVQCQQPDDSWVQCTGATSEPDVVVHQLAAQRRARPDFEFRIARRATTDVTEVVVVGPS